MSDPTDIAREWYRKQGRHISCLTEPEIELIHKRHPAVSMAKAQKIVGDYRRDEQKRRDELTPKVYPDDILRRPWSRAGLGRLLANLQSEDNETQKEI